MKKQTLLPSLALAVSAILGLSSAHAADPVITDPTSTTIGIVTGGDPGEGLDLQGEFIYAISAGAEPDLDVTIGNANFKGTAIGDEIPGVNLVAGNRILNWYNVNYGDTQADDDLEKATSSIRWSAAGAAIPAVTVTLDNLQIGVAYKFQMMFGEQCCNRGFDIFFDDVLVVKDLNPGNVHGGIANGSQEAVVTHTYIPKSSTVVLRFDGNESSGDYSDHNAILNAITVEKLGIPADTDKDGMPDTWETRYGLNPNDASDAAKDADGDGVSNLDEFKAGTDPADKTAPTLVSAAAQSTVDTALLTFSESLDPASVTATANYSISPALTVLSAAPGAKANQVIITTAVQQSGGTPYTVTVTGVRDQSKNAIGAGAKATFFSTLNTKDKVKGYPGFFLGSGTYSLSGEGATGKPGDYALNTTLNGGPVVVNAQAFLDAANAATANDELSVAFWQKKLDVADSSAFTLNSPTAGNHRGFHAHVPWSNQHIYFDTTGCCDGATQRIEAGIDTFAGYDPADATYWTSKWHLFVFTKKGSLKNIYVDGELFLSGESTNPLLTDHNALYIGSGADGGEASHAFVDGFSIYSKELTEANIKALVNGTLPTALPAATGLMGYWDFDDIPANGVTSGADPAPNSKTAGPSQSVQVSHADGTLVWDANKASLQIDGVTVPTSNSKVGSVVTVKHTPSTLFASESKHTASLYYDGSLVYQWSFSVVKYNGTTKDKIAGYPGFLYNGAIYTDDAGGHTGKAGDYAVNLTSRGGPVVVNNAQFLAAANAATANDELSVAFWQKKLDVADSSAFTLHSPSASAGGRGFHAHVPWSNQHIYFDTTGCCDGSTQRIEAGIDTFSGYDPADATFWTSKWHFFVFTKKADQKNIYVDGQLFLNGSNTNPLFTDHTAFYMGSGAGGGEVSHAIIDDFAIFGKELTEANVAALYNGTLPTAIPSAGLLAYWDYNDKTVAPPTAPTLSIATNPQGKIVLTFEGTLQSSDTVGGTYTDVAGSSPLTLDAASSKFYRAVKK